MSKYLESCTNECKIVMILLVVVLGFLLYKCYNKPREGFSILTPEQEQRRLRQRHEDIQPLISILRNKKLSQKEMNDVINNIKIQTQITIKQMQLTQTQMPLTQTQMPLTQTQMPLPQMRMPLTQDQMLIETLLYLLNTSINNNKDLLNSTNIQTLVEILNLSKQLGISTTRGLEQIITTFKPTIPQIPTVSQISTVKPTVKPNVIPNVKPNVIPNVIPNVKPNIIKGPGALKVVKQN
jgi:hypothetical protein